jgi:hypothetical protein
MSHFEMVWFFRVQGHNGTFFGAKPDPNIQFACIAQKLMHYSS